MVPSPRKRAPAAFAQTWHETDAASFDPALLPVPKAPRAWERKQEKTVTRDGKEKKIWRRCTTRSKPEETTAQEEETDSRFRAVKRLQQVRPREMEHLAAIPKAKRHTFKATRWDRRKSVLPRKNNTAVEPTETGKPFVDDVEEDALDAQDDSADSVADWDVIEARDVAPGITTLVKGDKRRSTFTFTVEEAEVVEPDTSDSFRNIGEIRGTSPPADSADEAIPPTMLIFSSPRKSLLAVVEEPETEPESVGFQITSNMDPTSPQLTSIIANSTEPVSVQEEIETVLEDANLVNETDSAIEPDDVEDAEMSDSTSEIEVFSPLMWERTEQDAAAEIGQIPQEEFTEASIQLDIQRDMDIAGIEPDVIESVEVEMEPGAVQVDIEREESVEQEQSLSEVIEPQDVDEELDSQASPYLDTRERESESLEQPIGSEKPHILAIISTQEDCDFADTPVEVASNDAQDNAGPAEDSKSQLDFDDITAGLTLTPSLPAPSSATGRKLRSPSPPPRMESGPDDVTATMHLDDDTALLKDFLTRAAASKASKAATITRRTSLQNRRDSDAVRQALASPRKVLEDKDPNSPSKLDNDVTLDLSQTLTLNMDQTLSPSPAQMEPDEAGDGKTAKSSRRSSRARKSRLPAPASVTQQAQTPKNISVRRADGGEPIVLKKTEAQELGLLTRSNTRKNKQGAVSVSLKLLKLATEAAKIAGADDTTSSASSSSIVLQPGKKNVRWDETLAYYQEGTTTIANALAEAQSLATPDELSVTISTPSAKRKVKTKETKEKNETPRVRRVRGLGATNGTPGKGLLEPATLLPDGVMDEKDAPTAQPQRLPKASKIKKMAVPSVSTSATEIQEPVVDLHPVGIEQNAEIRATKERKSRLASPKKVKLPQAKASGTNVVVDGKENQQQSRGIASATPKKGLKLPEVVVPPVVESGLPRRRPVRKA